LVLILGIFGAADKAMAQFWFLGVGSGVVGEPPNEYDIYHDVVGLWGAMTGWPDWGGLSEDYYHLRKDLDGQGILNEIDWLGGNVSSGDLAMFFYSGHGGTVTDFSRDEPDRPRDDEVIGYGSSWVTDDDIALRLKPIGDAGATTIAVFDSCYSGGMFGGTEDLNTVDNIFIMTGSEEDKPSYIYLDEPYSVFTTSLIDGISGDAPADINSDGSIYPAEWFEYVQLNTPDIQYPQCFSNLGSEHNKALFTPEPLGMLLFLVGFPSLFAVKRFRRRFL